MRRTHLRLVAASLGALTAMVRFASGPAVAQATSSIPIDVTLARVGARVQRYFETAQSVMSTETVVIQPLGLSLEPAGRSRRLVYDLRLTWEAAEGGGVPDAAVVRHLRTVDGRPAKPDEEPACSPQPVTPEPLAMLVPIHRGEYAFTLGRERRLSGRPTNVIDFRPVSRAAAEALWSRDCVRLVAPAQTRGRVWVDAGTDDVLRLDEWTEGPVSFPVPRERAGGPGLRQMDGIREMTLVRSESTIRYAPVLFKEPDETLLLPASIESLSRWRGPDVAGLRIVQSYSGYRRFLAESRLLQ